MFSIIIPTYNRLDSLQKVLNSLEEQTLSKDEYEVLVVFTHNDTSLPWAQTYRPSYKFTPVIFNDTLFFGKSASLKRNIGATQAQFPWLAFTDDDCIVDAHWLESAKKQINKESIVAIEGQVKIPTLEHPTFTYKGLKRLEQFGGYQTCNMFYRKAEFDQIGGFDKNLPFYLEDTDLAWSFLDHNWKIATNETAIVYHPTPPANVRRWLDNALRTRRLAYLYKKHPELFKKNRLRALSRIQIFFLFFLFFIFFSYTLTLSLSILISFSALYLILNFLYVFYLLRDCTYKTKELLFMLILAPIIPIVSFFQLLRGNIEQQTFIFP